MTGNVPFIVNYWNSTSRAADPLVPQTINKGGICPPLTSGSVGPCQNVLSAPILLTAGGYLPVQLTSALSGPIYDMSVSLSDVIGTTSGSYYEVSLAGTYLGATPTVTVGGGTRSSGTFHATMTDGRSPVINNLGVTNGYFANNGSPVFNANQVRINVTASALTGPPTPQSVSAASSTSMTVSWINGTNPSGFTSTNILQYRTSPSGSWTQVTGITANYSPTPTSYTVTGLTAGIAYDFQIKLLYEPGDLDTDWSATITGVPFGGVAAIGQVGTITSQVVNPPKFMLTELELIEAPILQTDRDVTLRYSDDGGATWSRPITQTLGQLGQYLTSVQFQRLGGNSRDRVFELSWANGATTALDSMSIGTIVSES